MVLSGRDLQLFCWKIMAAISPEQHRSENSSQTLTILVPFQVSHWVYVLFVLAETLVWQQFLQ